MKKVCVFGAFGATPTSDDTAKIFINNLAQQGDEVIAIVDNDPEKQGKRRAGILITPPEKLQELKFDKIYITSMYVQEIREQLLRLNIPKEKIIIARTRLFHKQYFQDKTIRKQAENLLVALDIFFKNHSIKYAFAYGTALGLCRESGIIPTDNDIDINLFSPLEKKTAKELKDYISNLFPIFTPWELIEDELNEKKTIRSLMSQTFTGFNLDFSVLRKEKDYFNDNFLNKIPLRYFETLSQIYFQGHELSVPAYIENYLVFVYGENWKTPQSRTYEDYHTNLPPSAFATKL